MRFCMQARNPRVFVSSTILALLLGLPIHAVASPVVIRLAAGPDAASIQGVVDLFRSDVSLGGVNVNNGNTAGSLTTGRREINWDGGGAAANATTFPSPMNTFNSGATTRGLVSTTPGTALEISGQPLPEFGDINATYPATFATFSAPRLFSPLNSTIVDVLFFRRARTFRHRCSDSGRCSRTLTSRPPRVWSSSTRRMSRSVRSSLPPSTTGCHFWA